MPPRLTRIGEGISGKVTNLIWGPPFPSNSLTLGIAVGDIMHRNRRRWVNSRGYRSCVLREIEIFPLLK